MTDTEIVSTQDPEVAEAFQDVSNNPMNYSKYENNPKIKSIINKLATKFGGGMGAGAGAGPGAGFPGMGGFPGGAGGFPGGFPDGFPGFGGPKPESGEGDDLD